MRRPRTAALGLLASGFLAACGALDPFPTIPHNAEPGQPAGQRVAICYDRLASTLVEVRQQAQHECPANTTAAPLQTDWIMQNCPILLPARATFVCTAKR